MDKRFKDMVLEEIRTDKEVLDIEKKKELLNSRYDEDVEGWSPADEDLVDELAHRHDAAIAAAKGRAEAFWAEVRPGRAFVHKRYIDKERQPERCVITKLEYCRHGCLFQVYYRTADGAGMRTKCEPMYFRRESFLEWA